MEPVRTDAVYWGRFVFFLVIGEKIRYTQMKEGYI